MNKIKLSLIIIAPLLLAFVISTPLIIKSYNNYKNEKEYNKLILEGKNIDKTLTKLTQEKNKLSIKYDQIKNSKQNKEEIEKEYNDTKQEISKIEKKIKETDKKINTQKQLNDKIKKYVY